MKKITYLLCLFSAAQLNYGCPTCVGKVSDDSPPFFSAELYENQENSTETEQNIEEETRLINQ